MRIPCIAGAALVVAVAAAFAPATLATAQYEPPDGGHRHGGERRGLTDRQLDVVRDATAPYRDVRRARSAGYHAIGACAADPNGSGAMGIHYVNDELAGDGRLDIRRPEILVYEPRGDRLKLGAVEYFRVDADQRLDTTDDRPFLFGRGFDGPMLGHEPGMPIHYDLHAWVFKHNPSGVFAQYNPRVSC